MRKGKSRFNLDDLLRELDEVTKEIEIAKKSFRKLLKPVQERRALIISRIHYFRND